MKNNTIYLAALAGVAVGLAAPALAQNQLPISSNMVMLPLDIPLDRPAALVPVSVPENGVDVSIPATRSAGSVVPGSSSFVETGVNFHNVTNNQGDWFGQFVRGEWQADTKNRWNAQVQNQRAFKDNGVLVGAGNTHQIDDTWFTDVGFSVASKTNFFPRYRADASINRRWLDAKNLVTTAGVTYSKAERVYNTVGGFVGASYYFPGPWIAQAGFRVDRTNPGSVYSPYGFAALTHGYNKQYYLTGRVGYGKEGYQLLDAGRTANKFYSHSVGLNWRHWLGEDWGYNLGSEYYHNSTYNRTGGIVSVFKEF